MQVGLNIPTTLRIAPSLLQDVADLGFDVVRTDVPPSGDLDGFVSDYDGAAVIPLFLLHDISRNQPLLDSAIPRLGNRFMVQIFNEPPGLDHVNISEYTSGIVLVHSDCRARGFTGPILMGGLANPGRDNHDWLNTALEAMPHDIVVDEHRYSYKTQDEWGRPWPFYRSRDQEAQGLRLLAGTRDVSLTETGWHTAEETSGWGPFSQTIRLTDEQARDNLVRDFQLYEQAGYSLVCVYQLNDGVPDTAGNRFGIRRPNPDGSWTWKPQASCVKIWKAAGGS